ncbi:MAG: SWIM zinc finger family protein [Candidatus Melainabacteria bacterium]|nr:SWIM zinc finger family protein [Candidatus Melainabacteria bacterium]
MSPVNYNREQVLALAPDESSRKAGEGLATTRKWSNLGIDDRSLWGECQGSGSRPYQTCIDLGEPAFKCTCPSRKFPCKHGLGLFLLCVNEPSAIQQGESPEWVLAWLDKRFESKEKKERKVKEGPPSVDIEAQAKRQAKRHANIEDGLAELDRWLSDRIRQGLAKVQSESYEFWDGMAARMVDAQAPGMARMLRACASIASSGENWQERLLERLSLMHLAVQAYGRLASLSPELQSEVKQVMGLTVNQDDILASEGVADIWQVMGQSIELEDKLKVKRSWLRGGKTNKWAMVLNFAYGAQPLDVSLMPGTYILAEIAYFPSTTPMRALVKKRDGEPLAGPLSPVYTTADDALNDYASAKASNPWLEIFPFAIENLSPHVVNGSFCLRDTAGNLLKTKIDRLNKLRLLAVSGGKPVSVFGEWDGEHLRPLSIDTGGRYFGLEAGGKQ